MSGETQYPRPRVPTGRTPLPTAAQSDSDQQSTVALSAKAPKWLLPALIALLAGGTGGSALMAGIHGTTPPSPVSGRPEGMSATKADLEAVAASAKAEAQATAIALRAELQTDRAQTDKQFLAVSARLDKLDAKLDTLNSGLVDLKVDVATLSAKRR